MYTFEQLKSGYIALWNKAKVVKTAETKVQYDAIVRAKDRLTKIEAATGVPWYVVGAISVRESGLVNGNLDFRATLHNGERIIGTGRKTTLVPRGLGPFSTWEQAAIDAVRREGLDKLNWKGLDGIAAVAYAAEKFNGFGYRSHSIPSPYLWGGTSVQQRGKYIRDGVYSSTVMDPQIGVMAILKMFIQDKPSSPVIPVVIAAGAGVAAAHYNIFETAWNWIKAHIGF